MHSSIELKILRGLAVIGLATALIVMAMIALDSGVIGGDGSGSENPAAAQAGEPPAGTTAADGTPDPAAEQPAAASGEQPAAGPSAEKSYVVEDGDSFYSISRKFNISIAEIQQLNPNLDPSNLSPGTKIIVP